MSIQASASTASTRPESGTLCSRFAFILDAGTVHVVASRSNSSHQGRRGSLPQDHGVLPTPNPRGDPEDHEPIDRKRMARLSSQMSRSHHPVEKAMAPVPVRDARQSFPPFDGVFSPFKHGSIRHGRTARTADRAVLVELRRFLAGVHAHWDVPDVHSPISTDPRRSAFKSCLQGAVSRRAVGFRRGREAGCDEHSGSMGRPALRVSTLSGHVGRPVVRQPTPALEQVRAPIRRLVSVLDPTSSPIYCPEKSGTVNTESSRPIRVHRRCGPFDPPHTGSR